MRRATQSLAAVHAEIDHQAREDMELKKERKREKRREKKEISSTTFNKLNLKATAINKEVNRRPDESLLPFLSKQMSKISPNLVWEVLNSSQTIGSIL